MQQVLAAICGALLGYLQRLVDAWFPPTKHVSVRKLPARCTKFLDNWDQAKTLSPPPFPASWKWSQVAKNGSLVGDEPLDAVKPSLLVKGTGFEIAADPDWVDFAAVARGQIFLRNHLFQCYTALVAALFQGYSIGRFSDILVASHYADSARATYDRYASTGQAIYVWMLHDLSDPASPSRKSIDLVRCMHQLARLRSKERFASERGAGVPLSQFDLALVQLAFGPLTLRLAEETFGVAPTVREREDYCQLWRYIGMRLGILDEYNVCSSYKASIAFLDEFLALAPCLLRSQRPSTGILQYSSVQGFGTHIGIGTVFVSNMVHLFERDYIDASAFDAAAKTSRNEVAVSLLKVVCARPALQEVMTGMFTRMLDWQLASPKSFAFYATYITPVRAVLTDAFLRGLDAFRQYLVS